MKASCVPRYEVYDMLDMLGPECYLMRVVGVAGWVEKGRIA